MVRVTDSREMLEGSGLVKSFEKDYEMEIDDDIPFPFDYDR